MEIFIADSYEALSRQAADDILQLMMSRQSPLLVPASGHSPEGLYDELVARYQNKEFDPSAWRFVSLDEWVGMDGTDEGSCRYYLDRQLFHPLQIKEEQVCFFDGKTNDLESECERVESFIRYNGGIDVAIVGIGMNGHVGMNEPGTDPSLSIHVTELDPLTQQVGQKYFKEQMPLKEGITLGLATLMEARHIVLLVNGRHKSQIVKNLLEGEINEQLPASLLRQHRQFKIYLDKEAASALKK